MLLSILIFLLVIFTVHVAGSIAAWYDTIWWLDIVMHLAGGAWLALVFIHLSKKVWNIFDFRNKFLPILVFCLGFVALIGVLWEFYEYLMDVYYFNRHPLNYAPDPLTLPDTLSDLLNDLIGGFFVVSAGYILARRKNRSSVNLGDNSGSRP